MDKRAQQRLIHGRKRARRLAMQALYQWQLAPQSVKDILHQFKQDEENWQGCDEEYFKNLLFGVTEQQDALDEVITPHLVNWSSLDKVDPIERAVLRMATYELVHKPDIPYRVVINEAVDLVKKFGGEDSHGFINAVLDRVAQMARSLEVSLRA